MATCQGCRKGDLGYRWEKDYGDDEQGLKSPALPCRGFAAFPDAPLENLAVSSPTPGRARGSLETETCDGEIYLCVKDKCIYVPKTSVFMCEKHQIM